ncbi:MAG: glycosyltransferase family 2 protein [Nostoc sp.]|uniref:glycosyltransferase family 2 protein n=1 Tax=unclassified Nostoc TaxID=2593658 RepID=UPI0025D5F620|nr:glycosyltransferase family 2 protein [Nostoc sp. NMS9]MBN3940607.1 glycosyltransferase family 2 protein [Nostoc sp. NMS9]
MISPEVHFSPMPAESRSVTVVIPAHNEEGNLQPLLLSVEKAFKNIGFTLPVLIIDDGSTDSSQEILAKLIRQYTFLQVIRHPQIRGVTEVWKTAIANVKTDWICWSQADLESDPATDIPLLLNACKPGIDGVAGWRQQRGDGKILASKFANTACKLAFGLKIHDMNWIKLVRRDLLVDLQVEVTTHRYLLAILAAKGHRITEVPTPWYPRFSGKSKFGRKRLVSSAIDFSKTWWWFYFQHRPILPMRYFLAILAATKVGFCAGREEFYMQIKTEAGG